MLWPEHTATRGPCRSAARPPASTVSRHRHNSHGVDSAFSCSVGLSVSLSVCLFRSLTGEVLDLDNTSRLKISSMASNNLGFDLDEIGRLRRPTHSIALNTSLVTGETTPRHQSRLNNAPALPLSLECKGRLPSLTTPYSNEGGSVAEWLACWTQAQKGLGSNRSRDAVG